MWRTHPLFNQIMYDDISRASHEGYYSTLSPFERMVISILFLVAVITGTALLYTANANTLVAFPREGGVYREGIVGTPQFIHPLLAVSEADQDLTALVYAGLMTRNAEGELVPELASGYTISEDKTQYTFTLRDDITFHDGTPLTAEDVVFTVSQAADPSVRSPYALHWHGVTVEAPDARTVVFTLPEPYAPFIENMTLGILPKHIWGGLTPEEFPSSQFNALPVGAGPYRVVTVERDSSGIPARYDLVRFDHYVLDMPYITGITFFLYKSTDDMLKAYQKGVIDAVHGISPERVRNLLSSGVLKEHEIIRVPQLRTYAIFFNQNRQPIFLHDEVRAALGLVVPKQQIVDEVLFGYGNPINEPIPAFALAGLDDIASRAEVTDIETMKDGAGDRFEEARALLEEEGWKRRETDGIYERTTSDGSEVLSCSISTVNIPELAQAADMVASAWRELGVEVEVKKHERVDLTQSVIRPRRYDALLFGTVLGHELDLYAFWHSSQRNDPGLNVAEYADIESDALLTKARAESDVHARTALFSSLSTRIQEQHAAIFLYTPDFIYIVRNRVHEVTLHPLTSPEERFDLMQQWYIDTDHLWPFVRDLLEQW